MPRFVVLSLCIVALAAPTTSAADRPNFVLMMADDLGWGDPHYMGNETIQTPHLDAMAEAGLNVRRFYAAAPVCSPTRGSCLTGRHPFRYGVFFANTGHMKAEELTLAELLKKQGYRTGHFGKWHLGTLTKTQRDSNRGGKKNTVKHFAPPRQHGFDTNFSTEAKVPTFDPMRKPPKASRRWWNALGTREESLAYGTAYWSRGKRVTDNLAGDDSRVIMDRAIPFIREAVGGQRPFFAVIWFHAPHLPVVAGPKYTAMYSDYDGYHRNYYGCITALDEQVGRLRKELRALGVAENTMLAFCSDNGPEGNDTAPGSTGGLRGRKRSLFEGGVRVPGLIEWPARIKPGRVTDYPATTSDYLPTIADALDVELPDNRPLDGVSLLPLFAEKTDTRPAPIAFESAGQLALIDDRYKLIHVPKKRNRDDDFDWKLFDLTADRAEKNDLAASHPDVVQRMSKTLLEWRVSCRKSNAGEDYDQNN